jgi:hypothetical protein
VFTENMGNVTREEMATYYEIRRHTLHIGITDVSFPRPTIPRKKPLHKITRREYEKCVRAELNAIDTAIEYVKFDTRVEANQELADAEYWRDEALSNREQINSLRAQLGLPPELT